MMSKKLFLLILHFIEFKKLKIFKNSTCKMILNSELIFASCKIYLFI